MGPTSLVPDVLHDRLVVRRRSLEADGRSATRHRAVFRPRARNLVPVVVVVLLTAVAASGDGGGALTAHDRWRAAVSVTIGALLLVRLARRSTVVSPAGIEGRRTLMTWRVPWSAVDSVVVHRGTATVSLIDGSTRVAAAGPPRRGRQDLVSTATALRRHPVGAPHECRGTNRQLVVLVGAGVALVVAMVVEDVSRRNLQLHDRGELSYPPGELRELRVTIAVSSGAAAVLAVVVAVALVTTIVRTVRPRVRPPVGPWERDVPFVAPMEDGPGGRTYVCLADRVVTPDGGLLEVVSRRQVATTEVTVWTYWRGPRDAAACVHRSAVTGTVRWSLTSWDAPLAAELVETHRRGLDLRVGGERIGRVRGADDAADGTAFVVDGTRGRLGTLRRDASGWRCDLASGVSATTRRLVLATALWAECGWTAARSDQVGK